MQHGEAVPEQVDPERPLSEQGTQDIRRLAARLAAMGAQPGKIFHSGKLRAAQTARLIAEALSPAVEPEQAEGLKPNDDPAAFITRIEQAGHNMLVAGHMPFVSRLCSMLLTGTTAADFASLPGTLFCLERKEGKWGLACMLRPDQL